MKILHLCVGSIPCSRRSCNTPEPSLPTKLTVCWALICSLIDCLIKQTQLLPAQISLSPNKPYDKALILPLSTANSYSLSICKANIDYLQMTTPLTSFVYFSMQTFGHTFTDILTRQLLLGHTYSTITVKLHYIE